MFSANSFRTFTRYARIAEYLMFNYENFYVIIRPEIEIFSDNNGRLVRRQLAGSRCELFFNLIFQTLYCFSRNFNKKSVRSAKYRLFPGLASLEPRPLLLFKWDCETVGWHDQTDRFVEVRFLFLLGFHPSTWMSMYGVGLWTDWLVLIISLEEKNRFLNFWNVFKLQSLAFYQTEIFLFR